MDLCIALASQECMLDGRCGRAPSAFAISNEFNGASTIQSKCRKRRRRSAYSEYRDMRRPTRRSITPRRSTHTHAITNLQPCRTNVPFWVYMTTFGPFSGVASCVPTTTKRCSKRSHRKRTITAFFLVSRAVPLPQNANAAHKRAAVAMSDL